MTLSAPGRSTGPFRRLGTLARSRFWSLVALASLLGLASTRPQLIARSQECVQPAADGCPLEIGQQASAVLADGTDVHTWLLLLRARGDLVVALTDLLVDYDVHLYGPDGELVGESLNEAAQDEVVLISDLRAGEYRIYVNSGRGEVAPVPYTLLAIGAVAPGGEEASQPVGLPEPQQPAPATALPTSLPIGATAYSLVWATKASMPTARDRLGLAAARGKLYAIGGSVLSAGSGSAVATVEEYDPSTNTWTAKASMPTARFNIGLATAADGKIYVFGSWQQVEAYDPVTNTWATKASMPTVRFGPGVAAASNGKIYVMGGGNGPTVYSTVEEYEPATNTWATKASMPTPRFNFGAATAANGKIYAVGGFTGQDATGNSCCRVNVVEEYDPATNTWATKTPALTARNHLGLVAATNGRLYMIGGDSATTAEEYDPATDSWTALAGMPTPRGGAGVAIADNGKIYAVGGGGPRATNEEATIVVAAD